MTTKPNPRKDFVETAFSVFQQASGEVAKTKPVEVKKETRKGELKVGVVKKSSSKRMIKP